MNVQNRRPGLLILEDATNKKGPGFLSFEGNLFGADIDLEQALAEKSDRAYGETVFNTSMTGYQEILTDPSYFGQIICMTYPHIGNTGVNTEDPESTRIWCGGLVVRELCEEHSNWRAEHSLEKYLIAHKVPGISGIDTRSLTLHLRKQGVSRGFIIPAHLKNRAQEFLNVLPSFEGRDLIGEVSTREAYKWKSQNTEKPTSGKRFRVVAVDYGIKHNLLRLLEMKGCDIEVVPAWSSAQDILQKKPDGVFLSNGPGDPAVALYAVDTVRALLGKVPIFGVCMGHQILSLAAGGKTVKMKFGHRGGNQPVMEHSTRKIEISSHNHGYAVVAESLPGNVEVTHRCLNDQTVEGIAFKDLPAFSVQYHPEACPGPHDSEKLFTRFTDMMKLS